MVQDVLRAIECGDRDGRGHRREDRKRKSGKIFWEYPGGATGRPPTGLGGEDDWDTSASGAGSRASGAHLQGLEYSGVWERGQRLLGYGQRHFVEWQDLTILQAADLRRSN